ncbi:exodeoxyribonuclease VII small subunit [Desulfovibrio desulfuricans]|uniref:Exodeoxyribonuclease 7 small subunit n=1 Tax=Desulfovibrio desulfuricans TaxID=876 RepID=A0A4P7UI83_DESDE|nr:exodeoxyribonuclease VII small subunit [Desulfovibrio desulfuricans]QCC85749.1 exodeoxyribonuclease VII small subunit [Desulfovibrio desulfuricans]
MSAKTDNTFEKKMARLQEIVAALENGDLPLEKGMALYKEGAACSRYCREQLEKARHELEVWQDGQAQPLQTRAVADGGLNAEEEAE